ncbi:MAG: cobalamin B12-binding domain-containing protein [Nitrospirae bacterium]|nr:cobalamin B12-binding domain-containing protein [Nitrospirota bacterium]
MKILLVQPAKPEKALGGEDFQIYEPLALEYLAAGVAGDHDVRIIDMRLDHAIDSHLREYRPDVVGITSYTVHVNTVKKLFQQIKTFSSDIITVVGGHHATIMPADFYTPFIDVVITGEGVFSFREVIARLEMKMDLSGIPGAVLMENGAIVIYQREQYIDLDALPFPRRDLTADYRKSYFSEWMRPIASIRTSKGCHFRCRFCTLWKLTGGRYFTRKPESIVEELGTIEEKYVFFSDDESLLDTKRMEALADLIRIAGINKRYFLYGRSDTISRYPELVEKWKKIGLERVFVGLEFMRDADLNLIRKGSTVANNVRAVQVLKGLEIEIFPMFIVKPEFERKDFADLRKYCLALDLDFIGFSVLTPLPGTDLYYDVKDKLINFNYDYFDFFHTLLPTKLPVKDFYGELVALYNGSRSLKNQIKLMRKYRLRELPSLFRIYGNFIKRLKTLAHDYPANSM